MGIGAAPDSFTGFLEPYYRFILKEIIHIPIAPKFIHTTGEFPDFSSIGIQYYGAKEREWLRRLLLLLITVVCGLGEKWERKQRLAGVL